MQALIGILQGATFTNLPELRSGEEFYWHDLAQQFIALARPSPHDDQVLRQHGWQAATIEQVKLRTFSPLSALQRLWPDLQSANTEHYSDKLNESACKQLIAAQPDDQRAPTARWLKARCQALGEYDLVAVISDYMREANLVADHPWATSVQRPAQFLLSTDRNHAFMLTGTERTGYTLHTFVKGESAPRERFAEAVQELMAPSSEWSAADWNSYAPLLQAAPASHDDFWEHPALTNFTGIRHHLVDALSSYSNAQWVEHVREKGAGGLLGTQHVALQRRFMSAPPASWLDHMADDLGLALDNQPAYRLLTDAWMALRTSDSECRDFILPAIREAHPELLGGQSDDELLALWRSSFQAITDNIRQKATQPGERKLIRTTHGFSDMSPESMREVLVGHYGAQVIKALEDAGKLNLLSRAEELPSLVQARSSAQLSSIAGVTTSDSRVYLIGNRTTVQSLPGLFLHEVGEHAGLAQMLGPDYGRMSAHFNRLLREKDTYATWAAMRVPADTDPMHVPSEQLAYLVERVANDAKARPGGERGYELGQECLANLRTWLFRTPLCRWLDEIGALDSFTLRPQDMAAMAREAVDFFAEQVQPGTVTRNRNDWLKELSHEQLDALYQADPHERIKTLERDTPERTLGYLYALAMTNAPLIETAIEHFTPTLSALTAGQGKPELRAIAAELLSLGRKISVQDQLMAQYRRCGFAMWVDGADTPEEATLSYLVPSSKVPGSVQVIYYRKGVGAYGDEPFLTPEHAVSEARTSSFVVSDEEAPAVLQSWASVKETDEQLASKSFSRWFGSSQAVNDNGEPLRMYHGTGQDIAEFRGTTIWASTSPSLANDYAEYRGEWQPGAHANVMPVYLKAERPFDADKLEKTVTLTSFFNEAAEQCVAAGRSFDGEQATVMLNHLRACSRREESGPYYRNYDIWNDARSLFGRDGEQTVQSLFSLFGYDSIRITEQEQLTFGVFAPTQVKSAIGNRGTYNPTVSDIRLANAIESERAAALQRWAGDSKVVDDDGHLLVVYHGSVVRESERAPGMGDIEAFDRLFTLQFRRPSIDTMGSWFSTNPGDGGAQMYSGTREGSVIYPVFLAINNPHETTFELMARRARLLANGVDDGRMVGEAEVNAYRKWLKEMGKDGIKIVHDAGREHQSTEFKNQTVWVALEPTQIKSAIGNVGTFNPLVSDIRLAAYESSDPAAALRHWSGDNKVVDNHGNPLVVFHGTGSGDLTEFSDAKIGSGADSDKGENTAAFWFTSSTSVSDYFAALTHEPAVMPVFIKMENPLVVDCKEWARRFDTLDEGFLFSSNQIVYDIRWFKHHAIAQAKQDGHDGVIFNGGYDGRPDKSATIYAVFDPTHIKSAIGNAGTFDPSIPDIRYSFAGERAITADLDLLSQAQSRLAGGDSAEMIRQETGWFLGHDQRWRFEIDDSAVTIPDNWYEYGQAEGQPVYKMHSFLGEHSVELHPAAAAQLGRTHAIATGLIDHPALFNAYPELRQIDVVLERSDGFPFTYNGEFRRARVAGQPDSILLRFNPSRGGSALQGLLHEVQHAIQKAEGFARGGSPNDFRADELVSNELSGINERINAVMAQHPETATVYRAYNQLRIRANAEKWPDYVMASVAAVEAELIEMPGGADLFDLETERMGVAFIDKVAAPLEQYRRLAGEVEARNVESRLALNAEQRRATPPLSTEDIAPELITVRANTADVLRQALVQEEAEALGAMASSLDMSESARLARAQALGFDTSKVWYHGTEKAGFRVFNTDGIPNSKTSGTGAFFAASESMAKGYSGTYDDAPIYSGAELFADPSLLNDLDIERFWAVITPGGRVDMTCSRIRYDSPEEWIQAEEIELDEGEELQERFTLSYGSSIYEELITQAEAIEELDGLIAAEPGIYSVYLRVKDVLEIDWQGRNWDEGPTEKVWRLHDSDGDVIDYLYNQEDAIEARAANPGSWFEVDEESIYGSTDGAARQARDMGCDAVLIRNVQDTGRHSQHEKGDIMVVFDPSNIRSVNAAFDPAFSASGDLMFSVAEAPQSSAFDNWFEGSQVVNEDGSPLVVYRGEHGRSSDALFQSRLGSLSFGDYETASLYATQPNNRADIPANPRIIPAYLAIKRPLLVDAGDPFIDFSLLIEAIGFERSAVIATELGPYIENTQAWADLDSQLTVGEYLANHPESLGSLYVELYPILDNPKYVDWLKSAGFDGAIYGGSGANSGKAEYRVFDPDQVASGAPMPVEQSAPGHSTRMALCSMPDAPICFSGSPLTGQQFTLEHHHIGLPGEYGYGIYLTKAPVSSARANRFDGELLTPAAVKRLQADQALAPGLRQFLWANGKAIVAGEDVQHLLQARMQELQNKLAGLEEDLSALARGNTRPLRAEQYAGMERVVKLELGTLINALAHFEHTQSELAEHSYLSWELTLPEQPAEVRSALAILGFDSYSEVRSEAGLRSFYNSVEAQAHLSRLHAEGREATWITAFPADYHALPRGADVYRELCEILGTASVASARLREAGIQGIQYAQSSAGQTKHRFVLFEPAPRNLPTPKLPALTEQSGHHTPSFPMAITAVPGIALEGGMQAGAPALKRAARAQLKAAEARVAGLQARQDWLKDLPNASGQVIAQNQAALTRARHELQVLRNWRAPSADNCVPWKAPLSATACRKLSGLINIRTDEQLTGEAVFHLLAERQGSNNAAVEALKKAGFVGADAGNKLLLWDESSKVLARELAQNHERCRYHLVAHGSKHAIDKFSSEKIGTGEGVQAFGYGLYFADRKMVAVHYQKQKVREGCWYEHTFYDHASAMVEAVANRLSAEGASSELVSAAKHCLSIATWAPQRVDQIIEGYPADLQQHLNRVVNGYSKISTDQVSNFFLMPKEGVRSLNEIMAHDDRDYSFGLSYLASGLHYHAREELSDDQLAKLLRDHIERQCDVGEAMEARHYVLRELEQSPGDDYLQSRLRDCDYYLMMAQCAQKTVEAFGPFKLERPLGAGNLYLVDLAIKPSEYVRFDLPYSQQPAMVQQAFSTLVSHDQLTPSKQEALSRAIEGNLSGHELYAATAGRGYYFDAACAEDEVLASTLLLEQGVQGIQYPDGLSRNSEGGTFNYVVFNDERVEILGHTDKHLRSEDEEIPLYEWVDPTFVPAPAHRIG
ncbi:LPD23 domain-containing protein (plasmid) [Stutzerimonas frequens]|uniref:ADP-ribosyltransferase-containing protein n=1 Tax=Stutzerimonas frequens TaxID=2968969 RepID=UPI002DBC2344|nr:LPD23 domain-containing protein [Stutzerimonas frequens]WRW29443.1 LPD23 domain-containing protein [Stutzerimonas frequens]